MTGKKLIDWTVGESSRKLKAKLEEYRESGTTAYTITSGSGGSVQTLLGKVMEDLEEGCMTKVTVLVRHSRPLITRIGITERKVLLLERCLLGVLGEVLRSSLRICLTFKKMSSLRQKLFKILLTTTQFFVKLV